MNLINHEEINEEEFIQILIENIDDVEDKKYIQKNYMFFKNENSLMEVVLFDVMLSINSECYKNHRFSEYLINSLFIYQIRKSSHLSKNVLKLVSNIFENCDKDFLNHEAIKDLMSRISFKQANEYYGEKVYTEDNILYLIENNISLTDINCNPDFLRESKLVRLTFLNQGLDIDYKILKFSDEEILDDLLKSECPQEKVYEIVKQIDKMSLDVISEILDFYIDKLNDPKKPRGGLEMYVFNSKTIQSGNNLIKYMLKANIELRNLLEKEKVLTDIETVKVERNEAIILLGDIDVMFEFKNKASIITSIIKKNQYKNDIKHQINNNNRKINKF